MYIFLFTAIPCLMLYFLNSSFARKNAGSSSRSSYWLAFCTGFFPAVISCFIDEFFIFSTHRFTESLPSCYGYLLAKGGLLPTLVLGGIYLLFSRREMENRLFALLPLFAAFYLSYLPYTVITGAERYSPFLCLAKPLLTCAHIELLALCSMGLYRSIKGRSRISSAAFALGILSALSLPVLAESLWYLQYRPALSGGILAFLLAESVVMAIFLAKMRGKTLDKSI